MVSRSNLPGGGLDTLWGVVVAFLLNMFRPPLLPSVPRSIGLPNCRVFCELNCMFKPFEFILLTSTVPECLNMPRLAIEPRFCTEGTALIELRLVLRDPLTCYGLELEALSSAFSLPSEKSITLGVVS